MTLLLATLLLLASQFYSLSHPALYLHCWLRVDCISGFPCFWLLVGLDQGIQKQETRRQEKSELGYLFCLLPPLWVTAGRPNTYFRWAYPGPILSPGSHTVPSIHLFKLLDFSCCKRYNLQCLGLFSQF